MPRPDRAQPGGRHAAGAAAGRAAGRRRAAAQRLGRRRRRAGGAARPAATPPATSGWRWPGRSSAAPRPTRRARRRRPGRRSACAESGAARDPGAAGDGRRVPGAGPAGSPPSARWRRCRSARPTTPITSGNWPMRAAPPASWCAGCAPSPKPNRRTPASSSPPPRPAAPISCPADWVRLQPAPARRRGDAGRRPDLHRRAALGATTQVVLRAGLPGEDGLALKRETTLARRDGQPRAAADLRQPRCSCCRAARRRA